MAEQDPDQDGAKLEREVARLYRGMPHDEPPARLDDAIRAQARRPDAMHAAPLVPPTGRRSWHYPMAAAAVIVLAVAVTWHVEQDQPDLIATAPLPVPVPESKKEATVQAPARSDAPLRDRAAPKPAERHFTPDPALAPAPASPPPVAASRESAGSTADSTALMKQRRSEVQEQRAMTPQGGLAAAMETPEQWLERIARLRREGRHDEADQALAEFRKRHPDFRIPAETLERVEKK